MKGRKRDNELSVCYFGTYRSGYPRNQLLIRGLRANMVTVYECHETLWFGIDDRVDIASGGWLNPRFWFRLIVVYSGLIRKHRQVPEYDVMILGYPGQFDAFLGRILSWWRRKPMVLDLYMSLYLIALERGLVERSPISGRLIRWIESVALRLPDMLLSDTDEYVKFHCETYGLNRDRFRLVPAGADERHFYRRPDINPAEDCFRVIYYGTFIPNHGLETIIKAAELLTDESDIRFDLFGEGPELNWAKMIAQEKGLANVAFHGWIEKDQLPLEIASSHVSLGAFGQTPQSMRTIQNKIWESMAMGRPVITGDSPAMRAAMNHGEHILLIPRDDPVALAKMIKAIALDPDLRDHLSNEGYTRSQKNISSALGYQVLAALGSLVK